MMNGEHVRALGIERQKRCRKVATPLLAVNRVFQLQELEGRREPHLVGRILVEIISKKMLDVGMKLHSIIIPVQAAIGNAGLKYNAQRKLNSAPTEIFNSG